MSITFLKKVIPKTYPNASYFFKPYFQFRIVPRMKNRFNPINIIICNSKFHISLFLSIGNNSDDMKNKGIIINATFIILFLKNPAG